MEWLIEHWDDVLFAVTTAVTLASAIAALTPTPKDDAFVKRLYGVIDMIALNVGKSKQK